jgi:hydrogenase-4 membrane subunit HyfE
MSSNIGDPGHGHSPAAWTAVTIMLIAFTIGTTAFFLDLQWLVWASAALLVVGLLVGWGMSRAGYGVNGSKTTPANH